MNNEWKVSDGVVFCSLQRIKHGILFSKRDTLITLGVLGGAVGLCALLRLVDKGDVYISMIHILAVVIISRFTNGYFYGIAASFIGVIGINYIFSIPYFTFSLSAPTYPLAFFSMLTVALITSTMTTRITIQEKQRYDLRMERMRANLLRAISHDLRSPLTSISGVASVLYDHPSMELEKRQQLLKDIMDDSNWLIRMVENLLSITRISTQPTKLHKTQEVAEEIIAEAVRKFQKRFKNMPVEIKIPTELVMVSVDSMLIEQVLINIFENVVYHAETATKIQCSLLSEDDRIIFEIGDDGIGLSEDKLNEIFSFEPTSEKIIPDGSRGMGIGLNVCKTIINAHGGNIEAGNYLSGGAYFRFWLPKEAI